MFLVDDIGRHRKILRAADYLGPDGWSRVVAFYVTAIGYAREFFTNGKIDDTFLQKYVRDSNARDVAEALSARDVGLWHRVNGGYRIHDFGDHNESAAKAKYRRKLAALRQQRYRTRRDASVTHNEPRDVTPPSRMAPRARAKRGTEERYRGEVQRRVSTRTRALLDTYADLFRQVTDEAPSFNRADVNALDTLLETGHNVPVIRDALEVMFRDADAYTQERGYPLPLFAKQFNQYLIKLSTNTQRTEEPWFWPLCPHDPKCTDFRTCKEQQAAVAMPAK